jgi:putative flavoprotein involved in K+ transport
LQVLIIGAGPAGLATAAELKRRRVEYRLFERGPSLGTSWVNAYDTLRLHTGRHMSTLPGCRYEPGTPLFPSRTEFVAYLHSYAAKFQLSVETGSHVTRVERHGHHWVATVNGREVEGRAVVMATGIMANPVTPALDSVDSFGGDVIHSVKYRNAESFRGKRVLVVGVGNSGGEIASELGNSGVDVTILVRRGANVVPRAIAGVPIQYLSSLVRRLPRGAQLQVAGAVQKLSELRRGPPVLPRPPWSALDAIPVIGFHLVDAIRDNRVVMKVGTVDRVDSSTVHFSDGSSREFDSIILATGFAPALDPLGDLIRRDERGFALRNGNVASADQPGLWFVGMRYDTTGAIANIKEDSIAVAREIAR